MTTSPADRKPLPPGRFGLPWLGETLAILRNNHGFYKDRLAKYGPVFKTRLFGNSFVVFSGHEAFHAFATDPRIVRGDADPISAEQIFLNSLALIDGVEHHTRKSVMLRAVGYRSAIASYLPVMQELFDRTIDPWLEMGEGVDLRADLQRFAARLTGALYTGDRSEEHAAELDRNLANMREAFMTLPAPIPGTKYGKAIASRKRIDEIIDDALQKHLTGQYDDIVSRMIVAATEADIPIENLRGDIRHLIFAGQGGYFVPLTLTTMAVGQHPDIMERARAEVMAISPDGPISMEQIEQLEYLEQISKEVRRFFAMNSATFFGRVQEDMEVAGFRIPKGWGAIGGIHINMRNPDVFPDPDRFDPDRFLPKREAALPPGSYVPHGDGQATHHRCPGENIVTVAVKVYLTLLLRRAEWSIPAQDLTLTNELFPLPASGLRVRFREHVAVGN
ncbi:cytochrome P450 [Microbacterium sp. 4R-513]|uniref:cytochrome P450 n=1 Tax=Microbacterium sp. 4R-513 TaxID=2567934 RepID=UPI0013E11FB1|nr:cytochrome P450 [Microbacterium sp. 4R-513]QIG40674.1 cytochrome P450 [Microbacterium sp. 4R-513]